MSNQTNNQPAGAAKRFALNDNKVLNQLQRGDLVRSLVNTGCRYRVIWSGPKRSKVALLDCPGHYTYTCRTEILVREVRK